MSADPTEHAEHHVYDDIVEHDNPLPRWWLITLYGTILFSVVYYFHFQVFKTAQMPEDELAAENTAAAKMLLAQGKGADLGPEALVAMSQDDKAVKEGAATFQQMCASCHGDKAEGKIGPNLTDRHWIYGGKPEAIFKTISKGAPDKGMPAWESSLGPHKTQVVAAYVISLKGKNLPGKAPQGQEELARRGGKTRGIFFNDNPSKYPLPRLGRVAQSRRIASLCSPRGRERSVRQSTADHLRDPLCDPLRCSVDQDRGSPSRSARHPSAAVLPLRGDLQRSGRLDAPLPRRRVGPLAPVPHHHLRAALVRVCLPPDGDDRRCISRH